ncbi:MAG: YceI family protein [Porticoccaceae bacterium]|jgi:polyisoprenoid-binding protein YceI|nr:YceI family protein [Porticoccaceae bacterium]MBT5578514.1 YceI family protein [Porticoccaceae bacterium]MBT7375387.1 YceI family protein [Porticoccaceae bacterium]
MKLQSLTTALFVLCSFSFGATQANEWQSSSTESRLWFAPSFEGLPINGNFNQFSVMYSTLPASLIVRVSIDSADLSNEDLNEAIKAADWFATAAYPEAVFTSQNILSDGSKTGFLATGKLQLKGIEKSLQVPFNWVDLGEGKASMVGELVLGRNDFAIGLGEWATGDQIGLEVRVWFDVRLFTKHE